VRIFVDGEAVQPLDPLLQQPPRDVPSGGAATPFGEEFSYEVRVPDDSTKTSVVHVRFTLLPVAAWAALPLQEKRRLGIVGGAGVSVIRAGREIDYGWYFMGAKRKENYDDWWRCEVRFEPPLDEYFGVTHSKQGITPHPQLLEVIAPDIEQIARTLNSRVRSEFVRLTRLSTAGIPRARSADPGSARSPEERNHDAAMIASRQERFLPPLNCGARRYRIAAAALPLTRFFTVTLDGDTIVLTLNTNHPFYERIYIPACAGSSGERYRLECLLLAAARAEFGADSGAADGAESLQDPQNGDGTSVPSVHHTLEAQREAWSDALAAFLSRRKCL